VTAQAAPVGLDNVTVELVDSVEKAAELMRWLGERHEHDLLGCDTESTGLGPPHKERLRLFQVGDSVRGWAMPWEQWRGVAEEVVRKWEGEWVFHNAPFDVPLIEYHSDIVWPWDRTHDSMLMWQIRFPGPGNGLKPRADQYVDPRASAGDRLLKAAFVQQGWGWDTVPIGFEPYWSYGALDPVLAVHLAVHPEARAIDPRVYDVERTVMRITTRMSQRGAKIDRAYVAAEIGVLTTWAEHTRAWAKQTYGINVGSNDQLADALIRQGVELTEVTPTGKWKLDKPVLASIRHPLAETALKVRQAEKVVSGYLENFLANADADDYVHARIRQLAARTSRMSITDPALQTLPARTAQGPIVRKAFVATGHDGLDSPTHVLGTVDYDQIEMRLMAHFSRDQGLVDAFNSPEDFFNVLARRVFQDPTIVKGDVRRQWTKNTAYAKTYGAGVAKMALTAGVPVEHMEQINAKFEADFPGIPAFMREVERIANKREKDEGAGYVITPGGRKLYCDRGKSYTLVNYLIQGHAAEIMKQALVELDAVGLGEFLVLPVHDEVVLDMPRGSAREIMEVAARAMAQDNYLVPITAGPEGPFARWGDKIGETGWEDELRAESEEAS
jgi:DNA polymerase-1